MGKQLVRGVAVTIRHLRSINEMSQEELAHKAHLDRTYISGVERGVRNITLESLEAIVIAFEISLSSFLEELKKVLSTMNYEEQ